MMGLIDQEWLRSRNCPEKLDIRQPVVLSTSPHLEILVFRIITRTTFWASSLTSDTPNRPASCVEAMVFWYCIGRSITICLTRTISVTTYCFHSTFTFLVIFFSFSLKFQNGKFCLLLLVGDFFYIFLAHLQGNQNRQ